MTWIEKLGKVLRINWLPEDEDEDEEFVCNQTMDFCLSASTRRNANFKQEHNNDDNNLV